MPQKVKITQVETYPVIDPERSHLFQITGPRGGMRAYQKPGSSNPLWSVTSVLSNTVAKPALMYWHNTQGREAIVEQLGPVVGETLTQDMLDTALKAARTRPSKTSKEAADLGTRAHDMISEYINMRIENVESYPIIPDDLRTVWQSYLQWEGQSGIHEYLKTEFAVYSETFRYAGSVDALAVKDDGTFMVIDWKTSKGLYSENAMQVAAYANALSYPLNIANPQAGQMGTPVPHDKLWDTWTMIEPWVIRLGKEDAEFEARQVTNPQLALDGFLNAMEMWYSLGLPGLTDTAKEELESYFNIPEGLPSVW